ncbi:MAG: ParB/RepB/Spo0J family partition protein [Deltaproteobacteria bacterium]|nr:MAG: ParB/RepB/Spo0J family partition protein [Deltaproteobacteria bacterium]
MSPSAKRGLGRGLASLIPDSTLEGSSTGGASGQVRQVPLDEIRPNPEQPREHFEPAALQALANSIASHGVLSPLVVRREDGRYVLLAGERRLRAAGLAGLHEVPCLVRDAASSLEQLEVALVENLLREDLDPIEAARGYRRLLDDFGLTQEQVAQRVGRKRATIANAVRLLELPDAILAAVQSGQISAGHARAILPLLDDPATLRGLIAQTIDKGWSVREVERQVARLTRAPPIDRSNERLRRQRTLEYATQLLRDALKTSVQIRPLKRGGGRIVIDYADPEDLERLLEHMRSEAASPSR